MRKTKLKWFTLLEMLIVIVIIGILAIVLTESYITISQVALRVEQEKNMSEESLILTQVFQAISDEATIDYEKYGSGLKESKWFTETLYLTWGQWSGTSIYTTWGENCLHLYEEFPMDENGNYEDYTERIQKALTWCRLEMKQEIDDGSQIITQLTTPGKVITSEVMFKVIPYDTDENYFNTEWVIVNDLHQPAFWMFIHLYAALYQPKWTNNIHQPLQLFFNLKL